MTKLIAPLLAAGLLISGPVPAMDDLTDAEPRVDITKIAQTLLLLIGGPAVPQPAPVELPEPAPAH